MEMGTSQRVVKYSITQKEIELRVSHYFHHPPSINFKLVENSKKKHKRLLVTNERCLHSMGLSHAIEDRKFTMILLKDL